MLSFVIIATTWEALYRYLYISKVIVKSRNPNSILHLTKKILDYVETSKYPQVEISASSYER